MSKMSLAILASVVVSSGCSTWSTSAVSNVRQGSSAEPVKIVSPNQVQITEADIADRPYKSLGDISITVNKTTIFHDNPTREIVNKKLQEEAAKLGADAVVLVRYGEGGISLMSWGSLEGKGRAVSFTR